MLSIVIPLYNEESVIPELLARLEATLGNVQTDMEVLFVDDGSTDSTLPSLRTAAEEKDWIRILSLSRNFGHQSAILCGLEYAGGDTVAIIDGDLQDPPEIIPDMVALLEQGWDVVYAIRKRRKESVWLRLAYTAFYHFLKFVATIPIPVNSGDFCVMRSFVAKTIVDLPERNKFLRGLRSWVGFRQTGFPYERSERYAGTPKYTLSKLIRLALDGILSFSFFPLRLISLLGVLFAFIGGVGALHAIIGKIIGNVQIPGWTSVIVTVLFVGGIQLIVIATVGEYLARVYDETKQRPPYIIKFKNFK